MNNKIKYFFLVIGVLVFVNSNAQLSMFNKVDALKGLTTKVIPSGDKIIVFDTPQDASDTVKFRMTKFDECRRLDWVKDFVIDDVSGVTKLDAVTIGDNDGDVFLLLKSPFYRLTLVKMNSTGDIYWTKTIHSKDGDNIYSEYSNILLNDANDVLYIVSGYKSGNTSIFSLDLDGNVLSSKIVNGFEHKSSVINGKGDLTMFDKTKGYMNVDLDDDIIDTILWSKSIPDTLFFDELNDPIAVAGLGDTSVITGVVDTMSKQDTAIYRLVKFDKNGDIVNQTKGFYADTTKLFANNSLNFMRGDIKIPKPIYYMINKKVFFFNSNLEKGANPKIYKFNDRDNYEVFSTSLEICDDESLVMSGFCYEIKENGDINNENPYMFLSKTQPGSKFEVEAETENCLADSTSSEFENIKEFVVVESIFSMDTIELIVEGVESRFKLLEGFDDDFCGIVKMEKEKRDTVILCPGESAKFDYPTLKCSGEHSVWSTGDKGVSEIRTTEAGEYSVTVTFCDSVRVHKYLYKYTEDVESCFKVYYPNAFFPKGKDTINTIFKVLIDTEYKEKDYNFTSFEMKIFDRWGEKVFETTDPKEGWDGTFRGSELPPGAYLYNNNWKVDINGKKEYQGGKKGQIMLLK